MTTITQQSSLDHLRNPLQPSPTRRVYRDKNLLQIAMPVGGLASGCVCLNGHGGLQDFALRHRPATTALQDGHGTTDAAFALLHVKGETPVTKLVEGPLPVEKIYDQGLQAQGYRKGGHEGLPRFEACEFEAEYPFGQVRLSDPNVPLSVSIDGWNPFIPSDDAASSFPVAVLEYSFENTSDTPVTFEFSYHVSNLALGESGWKGTHSELLGQTGVLFSNTENRFHRSFGTVALATFGHTPKIKTNWFRGGWFDGISMLWREVSSGQFRENDASSQIESDSRNGGSLLIETTLGPGERTTIPILLAWHFPNADLTEYPANCACDPTHIVPLWRPFYAKLWKNAGEVATDLQNRYEDLRARTLAFKDALYSSTLPPSVLDAVGSNLAILKSPTMLRQDNGNVWAWEGCFTTGGCCSGTCTHVWNYTQAMPHLFPKLERTLREQELLRSMNEQGHINFRATIPDGPADHGHPAAADGQLGGIMKLYRDWQISGDTDWLKSLYPAAKRSLDYCIETWDPEHKGGLFEPHHNTYDIEFWGPDGMCGSIYVGALAVMALMASAVSEPDDQAHYSALAETAAQFVDTELFNGEYYAQTVQWEGLRDQSFRSSLESSTLDPETLALYQAEGPKYQYGSGCLSDGIIGGWMATIYGIPTPLSSDHIRATLRSIYRYNYKADLFDHACTQRPGYAMGHEAGLLLCSWPRGGKPALPFVYSDEVWTGIEYQVASHLISEGMVDEGLTIVDAVRSRYAGHVRNPFNEYECGSYYARALASYALLISYSGFRYSAVDKTLWLSPKIATDPFQVFFSTETGFGALMLTQGRLTIRIIEGRLDLETMIVTLDGVTSKISRQTTISAGAELEVSLLTAGPKPKIERIKVVRKLSAGGDDFLGSGESLLGDVPPLAFYLILP